MGEGFWKEGLNQPLKHWDEGLDKGAKDHVLQCMHLIVTAQFCTGHRTFDTYEQLFHEALMIHFNYDQARERYLAYLEEHNLGLVEEWVAEGERMAYLGRAGTVE